MSVKLTKPQLDVLQILVTTGQFGCVDRYPPGKKLLALGFAEIKSNSFGYLTLKPTAAGREHLDSEMQHGT